MVRLVVIQYILMALMDTTLFIQLRILVYSFLLSKRNRKSAKRIHQKQTKKDRITLAYIGEHTIYPKEFAFFQRCMVWYMVAALPRYTVIIVLHLISLPAVSIALAVDFVLKIPLDILVFRQFPTGNKRLSKYEKQYRDRYGRFH